MCGIVGARKCNYSEKEEVRRTEVKVRVKRLKNVGKADEEITEDIIKSGADLTIDRVWKLCNCVI